MEVVLNSVYQVRLFCLLACAASMGCHTLSNRRQTQTLSTARQLSLRGADALQQKRWGEAEALFSEALRHSPADDRAQWGMAEVLWNRGECAQATKHMQQAAQISGENPDLLVRVGEMHLREGQLEEALRMADNALRGNWQHASAWALRGRVMKQKQDYSDAMNCYHRALIQDPHNEDVQLALAEVYQAMGRPQRALATLDRIADGGPEKMGPAVWLVKGQALGTLGEQQESQSCLRNAALLATDEDTELLLAIAQAQLHCGQLGEARLCLGRCLSQNPDNPQALAFKGQLDQRFNSYVDSEVRSRDEPKLNALPAGFNRNVKQKPSGIQ